MIKQSRAVHSFTVYKKKMLRNITISVNIVQWKIFKYVFSLNNVNLVIDFYDKYRK